MKSTVAFYLQRFLYPSMTFVYRQLTGMQDVYNVIALTSNKRTSSDIFPFSPVYEKIKTPGESLMRFLKKKAGRFALLSNSQKKYFSRIIKENSVKLIHAHFGPSGIEILPVAKYLQLPLLVSFHGYDASSLLRNKSYISDLAGVINYSNIIAVSNYMKEQLVNIGADSQKISVIYYGIPVNDNLIERKSMIRKLDENERIKFLQISNFEEKKGHKYTLLAFKELLKLHTNAILIFCGDGPLKMEMEDLSKQLGISEKVEFLGRIVPEKVKNKMLESDIFVHHSITSSAGDQEGIPNVIMEAMSVGMPVISTYHSGIPELIIDGKNGFLVNEKDVTSYTKKMYEVLNSEQDIGKNAFNTIYHDFNLEKQNKKIIDLYKKLIK